MQTREHHIQDASELYAVAVLQELAERHDRHLRQDSARAYKEFEQYLEERKITRREFDEGKYSQYKTNADRHLSDFFERLVIHMPDQRFLFENVEVRYRAAKKKADFLIHVSDAEEPFEVSLKNYRASAARPQVCSGTFNSFILNFFFTSGGVGTFRTPDGRRVRGSSVEDRDEALVSIGFAHVVPLMQELDDLNASMRSRFLDSDEFEFLDQTKFTEIAQRVGREGRRICIEILNSMPAAMVRDRVLKMSGLDGAEDHLFFDPIRYTDSITNPRYHHLLESVQDPVTALTYGGQGQQTLRFAFHDREGASVLTIDVPFTINKNGAWISDETYRGGKRHPKEGIILEYGQRRPKKSREIATSINTYVEFEKAGIFD